MKKSLFNFSRKSLKVKKVKSESDYFSRCNVWAPMSVTNSQLTSLWFHASSSSRSSAPRHHWAKSRQRLKRPPNSRSPRRTGRSPLSCRTFWISWLRSRSARPCWACWVGVYEIDTQKNGIFTQTLYFFFEAVNYHTKKNKITEQSAFHTDLVNWHTKK